MQSPPVDSDAPLFSEAGQSLTISGPAGGLEAHFRQGKEADAKKVAIICHPHPLHGGTMDNKVVTTLARTYSKMGWHSVRFNFRGVGKSEGEYGQLAGEIDDLRAVIAFLQQKASGASICLAGFSFGSAVAANVALTAKNVVHLLLVAPPVGKYDLDFPEKLSCPTLVVQGMDDDIVDLDRTRAWAETMFGDFAYCEMPEAGHFFHGKLTELADQISANFRPRPLSGSQEL